MRRLDGKVVLVTGSATGVGEGIVRRAAEEGAVVIVHGREEERENGERVASDLDGLFVGGDLTDPAVPVRLIDEAVAHRGRLDGLVNNAGISWRGGIEAPVELFDTMMAVNARAPFLAVQAALPHLKESKGAIVNIASVHARIGGGNMVPYAMSKAALSNMTRTLGDPLAKDGVRINGLNPGWILTPNERALLMKEHGWAEDWPETMAEKMPRGRLMLPSDVAAMVCYLLSEEASMVTGQAWDFDQSARGG